MTTAVAARKLWMGNEAICEGAIAAGVRFYAGYPITPCTEIFEAMSRRMPQVGGRCIQMEDEPGSINACMGASTGGVKAMTATAGPGWSLMQEFIGEVVVAEVPLVVVNVQRAGPGLGNATRSGQMDVMSARWGPHGDRPAIALAPSSVPEVFWVTIRAVNLAERLRTCVIILSEGLLGLMREMVEVPPYDTIPVVERPRPGQGAYDPYMYETTSDIPPMADFGSGYRHVLTHSPINRRPGLTTLESQRDNILRLHQKVESRAAEICWTEEYGTDDAEVLLVAYGTQVRSALAAMKEARCHGSRVGVLKLVSLWPFPAEALKKAAAGAHSIIVPEMNMGQVRLEVERVLRRNPVEVYGVNHWDSTYIEPKEILDLIEEVARR